MGRKEELVETLEAILRQGVCDSSVVVVDQNPQPFLRPIIASFRDRIEIEHLELGKPLGSSGARNAGWRATTADLVIFPDDDCTYPDGLIARMVETMRKTGADIVSGRCADAQGRNLNGNFDDRAGWVDRSNIWTTQIEWMLLFKRSVLESTGGFDPEIGVGRYFGSCEGQDISLRAIRNGFRQYYDPALYGHHPDVLQSAGARTAQKCRNYGRGMGYVLREYGFGVDVRAKCLVRPMLRAAWNFARLRPDEAQLSVQTAIGRWEGMSQSR